MERLHLKLCFKDIEDEYTYLNFIKCATSCGGLPGINRSFSFMPSDSAKIAASCLCLMLTKGSPIVHIDQYSDISQY